MRGDPKASVANSKPQSPSSPSSLSCPNGTFHFLSAPPLWKAFFVLSSMALSESVIFASIRGVGIANLLIIDPRNHFFSQSLRSIQKQGCRNPYSSKWGCRNLPFIHLGFVGVPLL